ncbi:MAG: RNA polymerase sigma factor [Acidobacteriia bacterium]|nr:RNA polymerase sigma factor [Terriglobia bacterium]
MTTSAIRYLPGVVGKATAPPCDQREGAQVAPSRVAAVQNLDTQDQVPVSQEVAAPNPVTSQVTPSDEALMARIADGDKEGLACLFHRYARLVRAVGYKILRDDSEADDLLQEVFLFIHQKSTVFDGSKSSARSWIVQMAYHRAIDRRRYLDSRHFYTEVDLEDVATELVGLGTRAERNVNSIEEVLARVGLGKVFGVLSDNQRQALGLHLLDGYTFDEIAVKLDQTRGNVKNHYFRGLEKLRKQIFTCKRRSD